MRLARIERLPPGVRRAAILRADASPVAGSGGALRLLAVAEELARVGIAARFALNPGAMAVARLIERAGFTADTIWAASGHGSDADATLALARRYGADTVVCDGLAFGPSYLGRMRDAGLFVVAFADTGRDVPADVLVNPSSPIHRADPTGTGVALSGAPYALIRREFHRFVPAATAPTAAASDTSSRMPRLLIACGAADATGAAARLLGLLPRRPLAVSVLRGPMHAGATDLVRAMERAGAAGHSVELVGEEGHVAIEMAHADMALCTGGNLLWELAYFGVPTLAFATSSRQEPLAASLARAGAVHGGAWLQGQSDDRVRESIARLVGDEALRHRLHGSFSTLVDGLGAERVARHIGGAFAAKAA